jgi:hypothetical protein
MSLGRIQLRELDYLLRHEEELGAVGRDNAFVSLVDVAGVMSIRRCVSGMDVTPV